MMRSTMSTMTLRLAVFGSLAALGCGGEDPKESKKSEVAASSSASAEVSAPLPIPDAPAVRAHVHEGGALRRAVGEPALYLADEDHRALRREPLPLDKEKRGPSASLPGAPANVLPLARGALVTVRDPGLLMQFSSDLTELHRVEVPSDAWGLAVSPDESVALVTTAWTHQVVAVDLTEWKVLWTVDVGREPRGIVALEGAAYVSHLIGSRLTKIEVEPNFKATRKVGEVALPAAPLRSPSGVSLGASLGYALLASPAGDRIYAPRHALGALGEESWFGASTVDVLLTGADAPLAPRRHDRLPFLRADKAPVGAELIIPPKPLSLVTQPRDAVYRKRTSSLLVASEGDDLLAEFDALGVDPTGNLLRQYKVGSDYDPHLGVARTSAAPTGLALSEDESTAYVWCRASYDIASVPLAAFEPDGAPSRASSTPGASTPAEAVRIAADPLGDPDAAIGRRLFYNATDPVMSGGLACAGCHPEGRDDGHVWHEAKFNTDDGTNLNFVGEAANIPKEEGVLGAARRTPMLAGMLGAPGPYGWHGESKDLGARMSAGFGLHRWGGSPRPDKSGEVARAGRLIAFLSRGLTPPPHQERALEPSELRGKELFSSAEVGCSLCHVPETGYTNRGVYPFEGDKPRPGFDAEENRGFKTPSLRFVEGRAPYFHDGRAASLEWMIQNNRDQMGKTEHLSSVDRASLIAFLRTL